MLCRNQSLSFRKRFLRRKSDHRKRRHSRHRLRKILAESATKLDRLFSAERNQKSVRATLFGRDWLHHPLEKRESGTGKKAKQAQNKNVRKISSDKQCSNVPQFNTGKLPILKDKVNSIEITLKHSIFEAFKGLTPGLKYKGKTRSRLNHLAE